jgi:hypothetical protein
MCGSLLIEDNRRLRRPVKGSPLRGRAELALDWPTRRFLDGQQNDVD